MARRIDSTIAALLEQGGPVARDVQDAGHGFKASPHAQTILRLNEVLLSRQDRIDSMDRTITDLRTRLADAEATIKEIKRMAGEAQGLIDQFLKGRSRG
jgi:hypothetical protein